LTGLSDPYFTVEWAGQRASTKIKFGTLDPVYNEAMYFPIPAFVPSCPTPAELNRYPVRVEERGGGGGGEEEGRRGGEGGRGTEHTTIEIE
jgi:hypothetical protein